MITPYFGSFVGGITTYVSELSTYLQQIPDTEVNIIAFVTSTKKSNISRMKSLFILRSLFHLFHKKPDMIHTHSQWYVLTPAVFFKLFYPKTVLVHTFHTDVSYQLSSQKKSVFEWLLSKCNVVTFSSSYLMAKISKELAISSGEKVIYGGVTQKVVSEDESLNFIAKYGLNDSGPIICYVGNMNWKLKSKGVELLVRSFTKVADEFGTSKLLLVGDGEYRTDIESLVKRLDLEKQVVFTGSLDNVFPALSICDIYAHISLQEGGVSISILEAMSMGKPVIASKVGGIPELVRNDQNGILVDTDPESISSALIKILSDKQKMLLIGDNGKSTVLESFSWEKIASEFREVFDSITDHNL